MSFLVLLLALFELRKAPGGETIEIEGPAFTRFLFGNSRAGLFWLPIRLFVGFTWLEAGYHKLSGTGWIDGGTALKGYWEHAVAIPAQGAEARPSRSTGTARSSRPCSTTARTAGWLADHARRARGRDRADRRTADGLRGVLRGVDEHVVSAGRMASSNPVCYIFAMGIMLAWKVAGYGSHVTES